MNGSVLFQFLWDAYAVNLAQTVTTYATTILGAVAATAQGAIMLYVIILGKRLMFNALPVNDGVTAMVRALVVTSLLTAANFQTFIATPVTTTIPNLVNQAIGGQQGLTGAQGWDALINQTDRFSAIIDSQAIGIAYIGDRAIAGIYALFAWIIITCCYFIWSLAGAAADLLIPVGAVLLPFELFEATRDFTRRWAGKLFSLFLVMLLTLMLGQIVVYQDAQYLTKYANAIAAAPAGNAFLIDPGAAELMFPPTTLGGQQGSTVNVSSAITTLGHAVVVFLYGLCLMLIVTVIALGIGGSSGFSAAPGIGLASRAIRTAIRRR